MEDTDMSVPIASSSEHGLRSSTGRLPGYHEQVVRDPRCHQILGCDTPSLDDYNVNSRDTEPDYNVNPPDIQKDHNVMQLLDPVLTFLSNADIESRKTSRANHV